MKPLNRFEPVGFDPAKAVAAMKARKLSAVLLTSPENVFYTTGYTTLPSAGNPILYMLRNRLPYFSVLTSDGRVRLLCWAFSTWQMEFGADEVIGFNNLQEGIEALQKVLARHRHAGDNARGRIHLPVLCARGAPRRLRLRRAPKLPTA